MKVKRYEIVGPRGGVQYAETASEAADKARADADERRAIHNLIVGGGTYTRAPRHGCYTVLRRRW